MMLNILKNSKVYIQYRLNYENTNTHSGSDGKESACSAGDPVQSLGQEVPLEKKMATHSSILAWKSPWTQEPGGLQSMGLQRVRYN